MNLNIRTLAAVAAAAMVAVSAAAQSVYPGQHAGKLKVTTCVPHKAEASASRPCTRQSQPRLGMDGKHQH